METQVESLKSSGGVVQSSHIHWHFSEQGGCILIRLMPVLCLHSVQTAERGDGWRKISKADNRAFCPWWCNVGPPREDRWGTRALISVGGKSWVQPQLTLLCSVLAPMLGTRAGPTKGCLHAWWQPCLRTLQHRGVLWLPEIKASIMWGTHHTVGAGLVPDTGLGTTASLSCRRLRRTGRLLAVFS